VGAGCFYPSILSSSTQTYQGSLLYPLIFLLLSSILSSSTQTLRRYAKDNWSWRSSLPYSLVLLKPDWFIFQNINGRKLSASILSSSTQTLRNYQKSQKNFTSTSILSSSTQTWWDERHPTTIKKRLPYSLVLLKQQRLLHYMWEG